MAIMTRNAAAGALDNQDFVATYEDLFTLYSEKLLYAALPAMRWEQFAVIREDLTKRPGDTIKFIRVADIAGDPLLADELAEIEIDSLSTTSFSLTIQEYGRGESASERLLRTSPIDVMEQMAVTLGRHYSQWGPDKLLRDVALDLDGAATPDVTAIFGGDATSRATLDAADIMSVADIDAAVELLQVRNVPKFNNEFYVCICHPHQIAGLRQDPDWVAAQNYAQTRALFNGEIGRWNDVVFIVSTDLPNGAVSDPASKNYNEELEVDFVAPGNPAVPVYVASLFGDEFLALAWALPVQLRAETPQNFGRLIQIAWYAMYGAGLLNSTHGVRIETA